MPSIYLDDIIKCLSPEQHAPAVEPTGGTIPDAQPQEPPKTQTDPPAQQESKGFPEFSEEFIKAFGE